MPNYACRYWLYHTKTIYWKILVNWDKHWSKLVSFKIICVQIYNFFATILFPCNWQGSSLQPPLWNVQKSRHNEKVPYIMTWWAPIGQLLLPCTWLAADFLSRHPSELPLHSLPLLKLVCFWEHTVGDVSRKLNTIRIRKLIKKSDLKISC